MEEEELLEKLRNKEVLYERILNFPKKVTYDCMIPLSKVAFSPGKIIHTNEFYKRSSTEKNNIACEEFKMEIRSYYDVAEELTKSIQLLKKEIESKKSIKSSNSYESFVQQQRSFLSNISKPTEIYQLANQQESLNEHKEEKYNSEIDNESSFGAVEIRETYDQDGNVIDSQVVNLSNEFNSTKSMLSEMKTSISSSENNKIEEMSQKLQERLNLPTDQSEAPPLDAESQFIRELAEISSNQLSNQQSEDTIFDALDRLERKEKSALDLGKNEVDQSPKQDSEFLRSKAWKKGFLSSNKVEKVEKVQDSQPRRPSSNESRTTRGILKYTSTSQSQPETVSFPSESPIRPRDSLPLSNPLQPPMLSETHVTIPEERPPPEEKKRVSKFMAERMGGVNMIADMNSTRSPSSSTKPFTGKIIERG